MKTIEFFFDLSSPYSYLASTQMEALGKRTGATVQWKPMVLGAVFKAASNVMPAASPPKARWMLADLERWSREYGVPFKMSSQFPANTIKAMRLVIAADAAGKAVAVARAAFHAMWVDDLDLTQDGVLRDLAQSSGLDPAEALSQCENPAVKDRLRANTDEAIRKGAFGAPAIFVGDELFWGNDRLHHVEMALNR
jgi:2-hydroxychromene-2-carboxylate isomerase